MNRPKILIIGAGMVGSSSAASIAGRRLGEVFLYDMDQGLCLGRAMDINHSLPSQGSDSYTTDCTRLEDAGEVIAQIVESMARDRGMIFPLSTCLNGEYGYRDTCLALPCVVDSTGVRKVIELNLNDQERASLEICADAMKAQISSLKDLLLS